MHARPNSMDNGVQLSNKLARDYDGPLLNTWRMLTGAPDGKVPDAATIEQALRVRGTGTWAKFVPGWVIDQRIKEALLQAPRTGCSLLLGQWDGDEVVSDADTARVAVRDGLEELLRPQRVLADGTVTAGTHGLVLAAKVGVPFATRSLDDIVIMDIPGSADPNAMHAQDTRLAVENTKLAVLVLRCYPDRPVTLGDSASELRNSRFIEKMLLPRHKDEYGLVVLINADMHTPTRRETQFPGELDALREQIMAEFEAVAASLLPTDADGTEPSAYGGAPGRAALIEACLDSIADRLPVLYLRARHAAAAVLGHANHDLLSAYCANPQRFGLQDMASAPLVLPTRKSPDELYKFVDSTGVPRLLELICAVRSDAVGELADVLTTMRDELAHSIQKIDQQAIQLPPGLFLCFEDWAEKFNKKKRGAQRPRLARLSQSSADSCVPHAACSRHRRQGGFSAGGTHEGRKKQGERAIRGRRDVPGRVLREGSAHPDEQQEAGDHEACAQRAAARGRLEKSDKGAS
jgi:hypothetical protein